MSFYALRIACPDCRTTFVIGGSSAQDLTHWRRLTVACPRCAAEVPAQDARAVDVRALQADPGGLIARRVPVSRVSAGG
jgi:hypothetical protein